MKLLNRRYNVARKRHRCDLCGHDINPGTRYVASFSVWWGERARSGTGLGVAHHRHEHEECRDAYHAAADETDLRSDDPWPQDLYEMRNWFRGTLTDEVVAAIERCCGKRKGR